MSRPKFYTVTLVTKPYLAKFIGAKYGYPLIVDNKSLFGIVIMALLQRRVHTHYDLSKAHITFKSYTVTTEILVPYIQMRSFGVDLADENIIQINRYFDADFEESLYNHVQRSIATAGRYKGYNDAIKEFCRIHGISLNVETTFECLKKTEYRFRKEREALIHKAENNENIYLNPVPSKYPAPKNIYLNPVPSKNDLSQPSLFE